MSENTLPVTLEPAQQDSRWSRWAVLVALGTGIMAGFASLLPWQLSGARLPFQNLWELELSAEPKAEEMPWALLPLSQYSVTELVSIMIFGAALAGVAIRLFPTGRRRVAAWSAGLALLAVQSIATVQSFLALASGLPEGLQSDRLAQWYFYGLLGVVIGSALLGIAVFFLLAAAQPTAVALGWGIAAIPVSSWLVFGLYFLSGGNISGNDVSLPAWIAVLGQWLPAIIVGSALAWYGIKPIKRLFGWTATLLLLWLSSGLLAAAATTSGTRVSAGNLPEMARSFSRTLASSLGLSGDALPLVGVALLIAVVGTVLLSFRRPRRRGRRAKKH